MAQSISFVKPFILPKLNADYMKITAAKITPKNLHKHKPAVIRKFQNFQPILDNMVAFLPITQNNCIFQYFLCNEIETKISAKVQIQIQTETNSVISDGNTLSQ